MPSCACGVIGSRARLRIWCLTTCRFESYQAHFIKTPSRYSLTTRRFFIGRSFTFFNTIDGMTYYLTINNRLRDEEY